MKISKFLEHKVILKNSHHNRNYNNVSGNNYLEIVKSLSKTKFIQITKGSTKMSVDTFINRIRNITRKTVINGMLKE
ncbi:hypothetical protein HYD56_02865 [Mycoplasmopsis bovis]|nr:hypothetical protein [Mycoplasmopsis bovis]QQH66643.1 hypothetical protein HYD56_02865 [Mycoplasmopsis bovis]